MNPVFCKFLEFKKRLSENGWPEPGHAAEFCQGCLVSVCARPLRTDPLLQGLRVRGIYSVLIHSGASLHFHVRHSAFNGLAYSGQYR